MNGTKMSRNKSPHTKIGQQVNKKNGTSFNDLDYNMDSNDGFHTQLPSNLGSLTKKLKVETKNGLSTPQCVAQSSQMGGPKGFTLENDSSTTPTLPQGAAAERQHHLQKKDVRRRLDMELAPDSTVSALPTSTSSDGFKTPKAKRARTKSVTANTTTTPATPELCSPATPRSRCNSAAAAVDKSRFDSSLGLLTKRFLGLLQSAENGILDLNQASVTLAVQKRRIYDITNVLEGIGLLKKISKNNIQWKGSEQTNSSQARQRELSRDLAHLEMKENQLDALLASTESSLRNLSEEKRYAYVTYNDLKTISEYNDNTVMAVRAPPETKLQVPHPSEGYQMYMKSEFGEIEVFLCPEEESSSSSSSNSSPSSSPPSRYMTGMLSPTSNGSVGRSPARSHRMTRSQNQVLTQLVGGDEDDQDKSLLMETIDQNQQHQRSTLHTPPKLPISPMGSGMDVAMTSASEPFLCLEPPLDESAYMFTMDDAEGLSNLFDFPF